MDKEIKYQSNPVKMEEEQVRRLINDVMAGHMNELIGRLNVMSANLVRIEGNTQRTESHAEKTNGRVTKLELAVVDLQKANLVHVVNCPNTEKIKNLESKETERTAVKKFAWSQLVVASTIIGAVIGVLTFVFKHFA